MPRSRSNHIPVQARDFSSKVEAGIQSLCELGRVLKPGPLTTYHSSHCIVEAPKTSSTARACACACASGLFFATVTTELTTS